MDDDFFSKRGFEWKPIGRVWCIHNPSTGAAIIASVDGAEARLTIRRSKYERGPATVVDATRIPLAVARRLILRNLSKMRGKG